MSIQFIGFLWFLLTGRRHSWAVADRDLLPAVFLNRPSREASGSFWSSWSFLRKRKKWGEISSKSEQTWFFRGFSFAELLYVLEIQTNIEWITNKKPAGSHEYAWLPIDQSEAALESHNHHHHQKITILWLYIISSYLYDVQLFYPDSILCLWLNHVKPSSSSIRNLRRLSLLVVSRGGEAPQSGAPPLSQVYHSGLMQSNFGDGTQTNMAYIINIL